jgi:hypothetical protein
MVTLWASTAAALAVCVGPRTAAAETYRVGPNEEHRQFSELPTLTAGDVVEVEGGAEYDASFWFQDDGTADAPIIVRGLRSPSGERPRITGGNNSMELMGDHMVFEGCDVSGG